MRISIWDITKILRGLLGTMWRYQVSSWIYKSGVQERDINLGDINIEMIFKVSRMNEITRKASIDERKV